MSETILFVISAPSGGGKTTILRQVMADLPGLVFSVSHTTRAPRPGEEDGRDYHFVSREDFEKIARAKPCGFLEWAEVHGNLYGTGRTAVETQMAAGSDVILDIDVQGAMQVRDAAEPVMIFIAPPSLAELEARLRKRGTESEETIGLRLANACQELACIDQYDYLVVNDRLEDAVVALQAVIIAERSRRRRSPAGTPVSMDW